MAADTKLEKKGPTVETRDPEVFSGLLKQSFKPRSERAATDGGDGSLQGWQLPHRDALGGAVRGQGRAGGDVCAGGCGAAAAVGGRGQGAGRRLVEGFAAGYT